MRCSACHTIFCRRGGMQVNEALLHNAFYGNYYVRLVAAVGFAFLMSSIPFRTIVGWFFGGLDARLLSTARGLVPVMNLTKAFIPVLLATHGGGIRIGVLAAVAAVIGDCFCPWLHFRGDGKGVAAQLGALAALCWPAAAIFAIVWLVVALSTNYAVLGGVGASAFGFVPLWFFLGVDYAFAGVAMLLVVTLAYRGNLARLLDDREPTMRRERGRPAHALERIPASVVRLRGQAVQSV
jgi:glycerol-3-phosphate acyltransferase PlsY